MLVLTDVSVHSGRLSCLAAFSRGSSREGPVRRRGLGSGWCTLGIVRLVMHFRTTCFLRELCAMHSRGVLLAKASDVDCVLSLDVDTDRESTGVGILPRR